MHVVGCLHLCWHGVASHLNRSDLLGTAVVSSATPLPLSASGCTLYSRGSRAMDTDMRLGGSARCRIDERQAAGGALLDELNKVLGVGGRWGAAGGAQCAAMLRRECGSETNYPDLIFWSGNGVPWQLRAHTMHTVMGHIPLGLLHRRSPVFAVGIHFLI